MLVHYSANNEVSHQFHHNCSAFYIFLFLVNKQLYFLLHLSLAFSYADSTREEFLPLYNSHKYGLFPNGTLSIHQLEPEESGYYLCKASNGFGEDLSKLVFLTVKRKFFLSPQTCELFSYSVMKYAQRANVYALHISCLQLKIIVCDCGVVQSYRMFVL